ncbi:MAG: hypothetical protein WBF89_03130 [Steroidobacteraceae bacterium]
MQTIALVVLTLIGVALCAGLSAILYMVLPQSVLECSARHGRFAVLENGGQADQTPAGRKPESGYEVLQEQSA